MGRRAARVGNVETGDLNDVSENYLTGEERDIQYDIPWLWRIYKKRGYRTMLLEVSVAWFTVRYTLDFEVDELINNHPHRFRNTLYSFIICQYCNLKLN